MQTPYFKPHSAASLLLALLLVASSAASLHSQTDTTQSPTHFMRQYYSIAMGAAGTSQGGFFSQNGGRGSFATDVSMTTTLAPGSSRAALSFAATFSHYDMFFGQQTLARSEETGEMGFASLEEGEVGGIRTAGVGIAPGLLVFLHKPEKTRGLYASAELPLMFNWDTRSLYRNADFYTVRNHQFESYSNLQLLGRVSLGYNFKETFNQIQYRLFLTYTHALTQLVENVNLGQSAIMLGFAISLNRIQDE